ncbi:MAG TPA: amidohydrolase family protein [Bryobacteraceae bacterium]|nr:amidohydrolase family protein [Bryobacteraceae bacterium]
MTRRVWLSGAVGSLAAGAAAGPPSLLIDTHIHLFADDQKRFPYHPNATYRPPAQPLEPYLRFVRSSGIRHVVIVHPEPYQDDHRYLEYCFAHEPSAGFFKGTCLFDPIAPETPARMEALTEKHPGRIVALRIHEMHPPGTPPSTSGAIKDRDLRAPAMKTTWRKAQSLGLAIQMHFLPYYAPQIGELAAQFPEVPVILDHLGRAGQGSAADQKRLFELARLPRVYMKYSAVNYSSREPYPYPDAKPLVRRAFDAFGPDRIVWGGLGHTMEEFEKQVHLFEIMWDFAAESDKAKIRGRNATRLYGFPA